MDEANKCIRASALWFAAAAIAALPGGPDPAPFFVIFMAAGLQAYRLIYQ